MATERRLSSRHDVHRSAPLVPATTNRHAYRSTATHLRLSPGAGADTQRDDELCLDHDWDPRFAPSAAGNQAAWPLLLQHDHEMTELKWISFQREPREYPT
jgi:hypothetical protein